MSLKLDSRQTAYRGTLSQLAPYLSNVDLHLLLKSINAGLTPSFSLTASNPTSLVVNVGAGNISNSLSNRTDVSGFVNGAIPELYSGTVTFPSVNGANITTSTGSSVILNLSNGYYCKVLISIDSSSNLQVQVGAQASSAGSSIVPPPSENYLPIGYVIIYNNAGIIQNIPQSSIVQLVSGEIVPYVSPQYESEWMAGEISLTQGATKISVSFLYPQSDLTYVIFPMMENLVDSNPQFQQPEVTDKTVNGFSVQWNSPTISNNYKLSWIIPPRNIISTETAISNGAINLTQNLPIAQAGTNYPVLAVMQNIVDNLPQFQTTVVVGKTTSNDSFSWNDSTMTGNYVIASSIVETIRINIPTGATSIVVPLPINYGSSSYGIVGVLTNLIDPFPQYQPLLITSKSGNSATFSSNAPFDSGNYSLSVYTMSLTQQSL